MIQPKIWAHRGASGYMPENTIPAFQMAIDMGADGIELDIQLTKDNEIVVCHDETLERTSNGIGFLKDYTLDELRQFNFNKTKPEVEYVQIPTMKEVFELVKDTNLIINIELKTGIFDYPTIEERIVSLTKEMDMEDRVIYSSFNHHSIQRIQECNPNAKTAFLFMDGPIDIVSYAKLHHVNALHPMFVNIRYPEFMEQCKANNIDVNVWTVNEEQYIRMCAKAGVNAIITNYPDYARNIIENTLYSPDYSKLMHEEIEPWLATHVLPHDIFSQDGTRLRLYEAVNPNAKAAILMVHGFCEFFGKHQESAYRFYQEGYSVYFIELRGHGLSQHNPFYFDQRVGVRSFQDYEDDVDSAVHYIRHQTNLPLYLYAHSMGGLVSTLYMEDHPDVFQCAVLSSPMLKINYGYIPDVAVGLMRIYSDIVGNDDDYAPGQGPFTFQRDLEHSSAMDADRYNRQFSMRMENVAYQTYGGTWGWVKAGRDASVRAIENIQSLKTLTLLMQAGADTMVDNDGQDEFVAATRYVAKIKYPDSRHEIYNATDEIRNKYYNDIFQFYHAFDPKKF